MAAVLDFEGFQLPSGLFIVKELAFYTVKDTHFYGVWHFQPPSPLENLPLSLRNQYSWVTRNIHLMDWQDGTLPYAKFKSLLFLLFEAFPDIYVKGLQKKNFFEFLTGRECHNLDDFNCPKVSELIPVCVECLIHSSNFKHCALVKAAAFRNFLKSSIYRIENSEN